MKHTIIYTLGNVGYFLIGYITLRFLIVQDDKIGFAITLIGLLLLNYYVSYIEEKKDTPKHRKYIKLTLSIIFLLTTFLLMKDSIYS